MMSDGVWILPFTLAARPSSSFCVAMMSPLIVAVNHGHRNFDIRIDCAVVADDERSA